MSAGRRREALAMAAGLAIVIAGLLVALSDRAPRLTGTNSPVTRSAHELPVFAGGQRCQYGETIPAGTAAVRVFTGSMAGGSGPFEVVISTRSGPLARGRAPGAIVGGPVRLPVSPTVRRDIVGASVCFFNNGHTPLTFAGSRASVADLYPVTVINDDVRVEYLSAGRRSWWSIAGTVAQRFALVKAGFMGPWTLWTVAALIAAIWAAAIALVLWRPTP